MSLFVCLSAFTDLMQPTRVTIMQGNVYDKNKQQPLVNTTVYICRYRKLTKKINYLRCKC